jgi:hypothetical protein
MQGKGQRRERGRPPTWLLFLLALAVPASAAQRPVQPSPLRPVVVELFTAQGCASCPDANGLIERLSDKPGVIALTVPVDYWDYLGWADTFAKPEFSARQRDYAQRLKLKEVYTPEVVIDGRREAPAVDMGEVDELISAAARYRRTLAPVLLVMNRSATRLTVGEGKPPAGGAELFLIRYDPQRREVKVRSGENRNQTVVQKNVVRELIRLGSWTGRTKHFTLPEAAKGLKTVVLLQSRRATPGIIAVARER